MSKKLIAITLVTTTILVAGVGATQARKAFIEHGMKRPDFSELDLNKDGKLSKDELASFATARFGEADTNGDGMLSKAEMMAQAQAKMTLRAGNRIDRMFSHKDTNNDGLLSPEELRGKFDPAKAFARLDKDGDGVISAQEFAVLQHKRGGHGPKTGAQHDMHLSD